jgi:CheY-like chemotaxis protein
MTVESTRKMQVLVVEDEPDFAALMKSMLENGGYAVKTAYNGNEAMEQVRRERPDVITLDVQMPRKTGLTFYREIKSDETFQDIPVIVVTGLTRDDSDMATLIHSFLETEKVPHPQAYLEKPVDEASLLETIQTVIHSSASTSC